MHRQTHRRQFLKTVALGALAGAGMQALASPLDHGTPTNANAGPHSMARLLCGCCAYSYDRELKRGTMTLEDFILKAVELEVQGVDMTAYYFQSTDLEYLNRLRHLAYKHALAISGSACGVSMAQATPQKRADSLDQIKKWVDVTNRLGASHLRVFAGELPPGATAQQAIGWVVETMKAACDYSAKQGVILGLEDHEGVSQHADVCIEIMQRVDSPYAGITLDITNFIPTPTQDVYAQIAACIPYATNTHIRDRFEYDQSPVDLDRVWQLFVQAGYQGYMSVEYESDEPSATGVPKLVAKTKALCKKYSSV